MKEQDFIEIIKSQDDTSLIGDDCAFLKDLSIVISQDNFIENVHFKREWMSPYQIGYKAAIVNISDILASGAKPEYLSVGLSLPNVEEAFFSELYRGIRAGASGAKIIGGDITGSDSICISIVVIGKVYDRKISSRSGAKPGYVLISRGEFGLSSEGLKELMRGGSNKDLIKAHLEPSLDFNFSEDISTQIQVEYAMMDTSDGLADALFQIAKASKVKIVTPKIKGMFGAEDYKLVAAVPKTFLEKLNDVDIIGQVCEFDGVYLDIDGKQYSNYDELGLYNHFGD